MHCAVGVPSCISVHFCVRIRIGKSEGRVPPIDWAPTIRKGAETVKIPLENKKSPINGVVSSGASLNSGLSGEGSIMNANHLSRKVTSVALAALLVTSLVPAQALVPIDLSPEKAYAEEPNVADCRTNQVINAYLTRNADGTYALDYSKLKTREQWKDLGAAGFFLYSGYDKAADILLNPFKYDYLDDKSQDIKTQIQMKNLGNIQDSTYYGNLQHTINLVKDDNLCRELENQSEGTTLKPLRISPELVAYEMRAINYSSTIGFYHCSANPGSDIIANYSRNYTPGTIANNKNNPFYGWYVLEKEADLNHTNSSFGNGNGHYRNIVMDTWTIAGGAYAAQDVSSSYFGTYGVNMSNDKKAASQGWKVLELDTYQAALDSYIAFVESQPSTPGSGLDGSTDAGSTTPTKPATKPQPKLTFGTSYTEGRDPNGSTAATYVLVEETGSPITLDIVLTLEGKTLTEGTDYTVEYLSNVKPGTASYSVYPVKSGSWDIIRGDFIILAKPEVDEYSFSNLTTTARDYTNNKKYTLSNAAYTYLNYDLPSKQNKAGASIGWHKINGKSYYVYNTYGSLICWDTTIEGTPYKAQFDAQSKTYYLIKDTSTSKPSTGGSTTTKPTEPEKPSTGTTTTPTTPEKPTTPSNPDKPSTGTITPSKPNPGQTTPEKPSVTPSKPSNPTPSKPAPAVKNGWVTSGGNTYYYVKGTPLKGWQTLSGKKYYFNSNGIMAKWTQKIGGATYYFNGSGVMQTGWTTVGGKSLFFGADGKEATAKQVKKDNTKKSTAQKAVKKAKVTAKKAKGGKKAITITWKKLSKANQGNVTGFEVQYSTKGNFKGAKTKRVSGKAKTSAKLTKLKSGTKYYVRVRAYKDVKLSTGKTVRVYGNWSKKLSAKTTAEVKMKAPSFKVTDVPAGFKVTITKKSAGASGYQIRYCSGTIAHPYNDYSTKKVGKGTKTTGRILGDSDGNVVWVRAYKKVGKSTVYSAWSKPKQAWPL